MLSLSSLLNGIIVNYSFVYGFSMSATCARTRAHLKRIKSLFMKRNDDVREIFSTAVVDYVFAFHFFIVFIAVFVESATFCATVSDTSDL